MVKLNLPSYDLKTRKNDGIVEIFDSIRKKYLVLTPEEWVRQNFLEYLAVEKAYPRGLFMIEKEISVNGLKRRPDLVIYSRESLPLVIAEFKAPKVEITEEVFFQAAMYNKKLRVPYLIFSNGMNHYFAQINSETGEMKYLEEIPNFHDL